MSKFHRDDDLFENKTDSNSEMAIGKSIETQAAADKMKSPAPERQQRQLAEIQLAFSFQMMETTTLTGALEELLDAISGVAPECDIGSVLLIEAENPDVGYFAVVGDYTDPGKVDLRTIRVQDFPLLEQMRRKRKEIYLPEVRGNSDWHPGHLLDPEEVRSILLTPLLYNQQSEMLGCLTLQSNRPDAFSPEERSHITLLCNQTASAICNIRLLEESQRHLNKVSILADVSEILSGTLELEEVLQLALSQVISLIEQDIDKDALQGAIVMRQEPGDRFHFAVGHNLSDEHRSFFKQWAFYAHEAPFASAILEGEWVEIENGDPMRRAMQWQSEKVDLSQLLYIPIQTGDEIFGVIITNCTVANPMTRRLIRAIANLAGSAIQRSRLLAQARAHAFDLAKAYETLDQMDRGRDEFIQNMTHDLRAPLTFIRGYTDLLIEGAMGEINEEQRDALEVIQERTDAVNRLVSEILKVKQEESQPLRQEMVDLISVSQNAVRSAMMAARKADLNMSLTLEGEDMLVRGDSGRLGQVFDNLLSNAIKYTPPGGEISIQLGAHWPKVVVSITDTGIGIPSEEADLIWERYYRSRRTAEEYAGTGLGLGNVRRIVEAHGGHIWVQSNSEGTTFTFELPMARENPQPAS